MAQAPKPKFEPEYLGDGCSPPESKQEKESQWIPLVRCPADFPIEVFEIALLNLVHHPEYNSTLILRSEVLAEWTASDDAFLTSVPPSVDNAKPVKCIHRKLLPRRPGRDAALEQYCTFYAAAPVVEVEVDEDEHHEDEESAKPTIAALALTPIVEQGGSLPYYHPAVHHILFQYISPSSSTSSTHSSASPHGDDIASHGKIQISVDPLPGTATEFNSRLHRTCLALLETLHQYGWGALGNYRKRVIHDCLIKREAYQDLYLVMRERHKGLVGSWKEVTDPYKHVFEDIGIATFLMLVWKETYTSEGSPREDEGMDNSEPWKRWPQPPGGFIDFGCGNGLLTHILISEGYSGVGIDLRARDSWDHYPQASRDALKVLAFSPFDLLPTDTSKPPSNPIFKPNAFIIANHADELTPWVPVVSTLTDASGYLSIPCCAWGFDRKFEKSMMRMFEGPNVDSEREDEQKFIDSLNLGGDNSAASSSYSVYRIWLARLSRFCGWGIECETLRIPSTRNWAVVGRTRNRNDEHLKQEMIDIIEEVGRRGLFKTRKPEGKAGEH